MARYQLILAYDGTDFYGFQRQGETRTVQSVVEKALKELGWQEEVILFAGRTDTGVHANGQVISFSIDWAHPESDLVNALNAKLPPDAAVRNISKVKAEFHPRYDATSRSYVYRIYQSSDRHPLLDRYAWRIWPQLDPEKLRTAAEIFLGRHDFNSFGRPMKPGSSTIREVFESNWKETSQGLEYTISANAFLYHMVRRLVFVQVDYARNGFDLERLEKGFSDPQAINPGLAPAHGLTLEHVSYDRKMQEFLEEEEN
jgi:tRNA pseudouridine38-40 synthase